MDLITLQKEHKEWQLRNFGPQPSHRFVWGILEECGEMTRALLKRAQGIRGSDDSHLRDFCDGIGDIGIYSIGLCTAVGCNIAEIPTSVNHPNHTTEWQIDAYLENVYKSSVPLFRHGDFLAKNYTGITAFLRNVNQLSLVVSGKGLWHHTTVAWEIVKKRNWKDHAGDGGNHSHISVSV